MTATEAEQWTYEELWQKFRELREEHNALVSDSEYAFRKAEFCSQQMEEQEQQIEELKKEIKGLRSGKELRECYEEIHRLTEKVHALESSNQGLCQVRDDLLAKVELLQQSDKAVTQLTYEVEMWKNRYRSQVVRISEMLEHQGNVELLEREISYLAGKAKPI